MVTNLSQLNYSRWYPLVAREKLRYEHDTEAEDRWEFVAVMQFLYDYFAGNGRNMIEIGNLYGTSLACFAWLFHGTKVGIDFHHDDARNKRWNEDFPNSIVPICGSSFDPLVFLKTNEVLHGQLVDFLFIDADHSYEATKNDYEKYSLFVRPGGFIGFHDINHPDHRDTGCGKFYRELEGPKWKTDWHWAGIGLIQKL